jgi:hypothetical protein
MRKYLHLESSKHGKVRQLKRENPQLWDSADNWPVSTFYPTLHPTLGENTRKKKVLKKNLLHKKIFIFYSIVNGIHLLPPMDLAHAHVQIKYKQTAASWPAICRTNTSPLTTPHVAPLCCP